ncbi:unnamed protein product (macronuclear) [Paramecium tetraurelia]|uniref:Response regulatory domain-containing protein n=1 Tax=Paramecium tetraurelia TaxID=5888 RepID=A0BZG8_PARTE|nr:uncharacterized protein GSPATT00033788001 [Paramecium tetraurelia]CAK63935.1 unnamed protein product [Paramecium tetraurelia]|eukprot:XP_001431333.1 hypothetical protein (macronuclear) [Paramecium tetraurelia strain d4-2]
MKFNNKEFWYYLKCFIDIALSGIIYSYSKDSFIVSINTIIIQLLGILLSPYIAKKFGGKKRKYIQIVMLSAQMVQIYYCCFYFTEILRYGYLLIKFYEKQLIDVLQKQISYIILIALNAVQLFLMISHNELGVTYIAVGYATMLLLKEKHLIIRKQEKIKFEQLSKTEIKPIQNQIRQSLLINRINESVSLKWMNKLQSFPVGIVIVKKDNLEILFENDQLLQIFQAERDIGRFILESLECTIIQKKNTYFTNQTSIVLEKNSLLQASGSINLTQHQIQNKTFTIKQILNLLNLGQLEKIKSNDDQLELSATFCKGNEAFFEERNLLFKVSYAQDESEYLIIIQDITLQTNFKKMETKEQFIVKMIDSFSHELRTPLNSAELFLQGLSQTNQLPIELKELFIDPAKNSLRLQAYIIRDIIDFTQFNQKMIKYHFSDFNFVDIIQEINDLFKLIFQHKKIGLHVNAQRSIPIIIKSDFYRIMQILVNIISNSVKFSSQGQVEVVIQGFDDYVLFKVQDQGQGIEPQLLAKIQQTLQDFALNRSISQQHEWQGLGLLVSQMNLITLAPQNKSHLQIASKGLNQGVEVKFRIKTQTQVFSQQLGQIKTFKRGSLATPNTVPDLSEGLQGITYRTILIGLLIIANAEYKNTSVKNIPVKGLSSVANYYGKPQQNQKLEIQCQFETDVQFQDSDRFELSHQLMYVQSNFNPKFITNKQSQNSLVSRMQQKIDDQSQIQSNFSKVKFKFKCQCQRALSVDDDSFNQKALELILAQMGFEILLAYNGQQAIEIVKNAKRCNEDCQLYVFILMDCQMPILDGWQTTKRLRNMMIGKIIPFIPIIGLTAFNGQYEIEKCFDSGMQKVLTKPLNIDDFKQALIRIYRQV